MKSLKRTLAIAAAAGMLSTAGMTGIATAQTATPAAPPSTISANQQASLHIHKFQNDTPGPAGNGTPIGDTSGLGKPLAGAVFKVEQVNGVDLTKNEGWVQAADIAKGTAQPSGFGTAKNVTTNAQGQADVTGLPIGLYRVTETSAPAGNQITTEPFYVTLPMTNPQDRSSWMYDVHVYPKNQKQTDVISKKVTDESAVIEGRNIQYDVTGKLPSSQKLARAELVDVYPADRLGTPQVTKVTYGDGTQANPSDYTLDTSTPGQAKVKFTQSGLAKLDTLQGDNRKATATFSFPVTKSQGTGPLNPIENRALVIAKGEGDNTPDPDPNNPNDPSVIPPGKGPESYFGNVKVSKTDENNTPLNGVGFDLYRCNSNDKDKLGEKLAENLTTQNGSLTINGLHVNDFVNGAAGKTDPSGYCLVEVKAAEGHSLLAEPAYFQVLRSGEGPVNLTSVDLKNVKDNAGFNLPLTGGKGVTLMLVLGGLIIVIGAGYAYMSSRKDRGES
ncbi:SpaH/EbpB family LPXTG-anchored major pilin [Corynebacterium heidelbergense]|uniref:Uncharacterized protein n=1 Tax=Corynebacterium heidelbergense TaxID=2055947 RepID=A0A364V778_9CORY|nr:SpaH/EbpB family LPXTG-anchored major pilin [Corynebacterium heidelbergense]RAV32416.1 hypothetical protein DLJ54_03375 [Corynebacterium heidelbergense]